jgi:hypothetical protein
MDIDDDPSDFVRLVLVIVLVIRRLRRRRQQRQQQQDQEQERRWATRWGCGNIRRQRRTIDSVYNELGPLYFRRAHRMTYADFRQLCVLLQPEFHRLIRPTHNWAPNGVITNPVRVACALRYFAGGRSYDICTTYGISHSAFYESITLVTEAVNSCPGLALEYPANHEQQRAIA